MTTLYCILARAADRGVIFRRGPAKQTRLINWDLKTHTFEPGQWFKGSIYVRKSDLSPDGTKLVYFAAKHRGALPTWVAVSTPPLLTAHALWGTVGTWNDISLFETDSMLALATYSADESLAPAEGFAIPRQLRVKAKPWPGYFYRLADHDRLVRDGWTVHTGDPVYHHGSGAGLPVVYRKPVAGGTRPPHLEMSVNTSGSKWRYAVRDDRGSVIELAADWADLRGDEVLYAQGGKLLRMRVAKRGKEMDCAQPIALGDFSAMTFEPIEAPGRATTW